MGHLPEAGTRRRAAQVPTDDEVRAGRGLDRLTTSGIP